MQRAQVCLLFLGGRPCATAESCGIESFAGTLTVVTVAAIEIGGVMEVAQMAADALRVARRCFGCGCPRCARCRAVRIERDATMRTQLIRKPGAALRSGSTRGATANAFEIDARTTRSADLRHGAANVP